MDTKPLADPVAEARRLISAAQAQGLVLRALGVRSRAGDRVRWYEEPEQEHAGGG